MKQMKYNKRQTKLNISDLTSSNRNKNEGESKQINVSINELNLSLIK